MNDLFDDDDDFLEGRGELAAPNSRGNANQDVTGFAMDPLDEGDFDYEGLPPGPGPAPATDLMSERQIEEEDDVFEDESGPGMRQTTYGAHPWGTDTSQGYRPAAMMTTDRNMNSLGEVFPVQPAPRNPQEGLMPSNADIDPETIYDRRSYESGKVFGNGIFEMEEGTTWRPSYGSFAHKYALPDYIARENEMNVQGSAMWDVTRGAWRVVQPTASGVPLSRIVPGSPAGGPGRYSPFVRPMTPATQAAQVAQAAPAPKNIEIFGKEVALTVTQGASTLPPEHRGPFIAAALELLGPGTAAKAEKVAKKLTEMGFPRDIALRDTLAHFVMNVTARDMRNAVDAARRGKRVSGGLFPSITKLSDRTGKAVGGRIKALRGRLLSPAESNPAVAERELGSFYASSAMGRIEYLNGLGNAPAASAAPAVPAAPAASQPGLLSPRNLLIGAALVGGTYYAYQSGLLRKAGLPFGKSTKDAREPKPLAKNTRSTSRRKR
jgi:hypothetical protein